jgi:CDGSH-type Zn-finger protein
MVDLDPTAAGSSETDAPPARRIDVTQDGPYRVHGGLPLRPVSVVRSEWGESVDADVGAPLPTGGSYALCRCGRSSTKPFCDDSHLRTGFTGEETADRGPRADRAREIRGREIAFTDDQELCVHAAYCEDRVTSVWDMVRDSADPEVRTQMSRMIGLCPSGRLALEPPGEAGEPEVLLERDGPIWVRGAVQLRAADGTAYEVRGRMALCRCGASRNKPFCDDTHSEIGFRDGSDDV